MFAKKTPLALLFAATLFVSAALLFWVQPMVAKMLLPLLGGTPSVWNTCMVFFQAMLLAGYAYALVLSRHLNVRAQVALHIALLVVTALTLPIVINASSAGVFDPTMHPSLYLLTRLLVAVGLPFFAVSASSPLLQQWFARSGYTAAQRDPYFLYAASNAGSLLALLAYPVLLEPRLALAAQGRLWMAGYAALFLLVAACAVAFWRARSRASPEATQPTTAVASNTTTDNAPAANIAPEDHAIDHRAAPVALTMGRRLRWVVFAFAPSSLMLGVTTYLATDLASLPLLWIVPLSLYLLTLVLVFARRQIISWRAVARTLPGVALVLVLVYLSGATQPPLVLGLLHLLFFFIAALVCHGQLAADRPAPSHLAEFYLWLSVGGVLGGIFNALLAPVLFNSIAEYPLVIVLACYLRPRPTTRKYDADVDTSRARQLDAVFPLCVLLLTVGAALAVRRFDLATNERLALVFGAPLLISYLWRNRPLRFALAVGAVLLGGVYYSSLDTRTLYAARNFYGVLRVTRGDDEPVRWLHNGSTIHGRQFVALERQCEPLSYYHRSGPLGLVFAAYNARPATPNVAIVGLGTGATAAYALPGQRWTFYEINPAVLDVARDPRFFTYLRDCTPPDAPPAVVLGDARLQLQHVPDAAYGLIALDAFSSDAIPVHLLTGEALDLYLAKLAPGGLIAYHVSNRSLDLHPVVADLARSRSLYCLAFDDDQPDGALAKEASQWIVVARDAAALGDLMRDPRWRELDGDPTRRVWTDDFSNVFGVFRWR